MKFPIFVLAKDCGEILQFESLEAMQRAVEAIDVENGEYEAWDKTGIPVELTAGSSRDWLRIVPKSGPSEFARVEALMYAYARREGVESGISASGDLVSLYKNIVGKIRP
jgi:hypothetical protein